MKPPHLTSKQRGTYYDSWQTPDNILDGVRDVLGGIATDLASSNTANQRVQARSYFAIEGFHGVDVESPIWCNPPGPSKKVHKFWQQWNNILSTHPGWKGAFLFFNVDHIRNACPPDRDCTVIILRKRVRFVGAPSQASFSSALVFSGSDIKRARDLNLGHVFLWDSLDN